MSHIPFDQIVDRVRELDTALFETQVQIDSLWLAGLGAAVRETGDDGEVISVLAALRARSEGIAQARAISDKLLSLVCGVVSA